MFNKLITLSLLSSLIGCGSSTSVKSLITKQWSCTKTSGDITLKYSGVVYSSGTLTASCKVSSPSSAEQEASSTQTNTLETSTDAFWCPVSTWTFKAPNGVKTATNIDSTTVTFAATDCSGS